MAEYGIVQRSVENGAFVEIALQRSEACKECRACLPGLTDKTMILRAKNNCGAEKGDYVSVSVEQSGFLSAVLLLYFIPALAFLAALVLCNQFAVNEWIALGLALVALGIAWFIIHQIAPKLKQERYLPIAEKKLAKPAIQTADHQN